MLYIHLGENHNHRPVIIFSSNPHLSISVFLTSVTLALLTAFQAIIFCLSFYRLVLAAIDQHNIESRSMDRNHLIRGTGWVVGGLKFGAIETVTGFGDATFGAVFTRRVLRFLSRAFLIIGIVKGLDIPPLQYLQRSIC
jgi:hypothetical protein